MRLKSWLWILALGFLIGSVPVFAVDQDRDRGDRSRDDRQSTDSGDRSSPDSIRGYENNQHERDWREYLKARNKSYKEWAKANRKEQQDFDKYLRERNRDGRDSVREADRPYREDIGGRASDRWEDQRKRDSEWREYLRARNRDYRDYSRASRQELDDFYDFLRGRGYRYGDQYGWVNSNEPRNGACFYTDANYGGESFCLNRGDRQASVGGHFNDRFSSIRIFGRARVTVYKNRDFGGPHRTYTSDAPHLGDLNDEITSIEVR
jgi:hypothetical protein